VAVAVATLAAATIPNNGVIYACYVKNGGTLHVIDQSVRNCSPGQTSLSWNVAGQTAQGPEGPTRSDRCDRSGRAGRIDN
jgi:hypothetical protein